MWRIIILTTLLHVVGVMTTPIEPVGGALWSISNVKLPIQHNTNLDILRQQFIPYTTNDRDHEPELFPRTFQQKRGFSMLARWRPFSSIGKQRSSIREHNNRIVNGMPNLDLDVISAETRALLRPVGQPLRWG